jgi:predicted metal-dependent HD superfamily phosphohydrolase
LPPERTTLDRNRWIGLWSRLGAQGGGSSIFANLVAAYAEPARAYHTAEHIQDCLAQLDLSRDISKRPDEVEAAIWFHDAVYVPGGSDNEDRSARLAQTALLACAAPLETARRIAELVLATRHLTVPRDPDAQLLCDVDLSILGREPEIFDEFERRIRREYQWVPDSAYRMARSEVLTSFLGRHPIYQTEYFRNRYETQARANLERVIARLAG